MTSQQHDIDILNTLIEVTLDSAHAYEDASRDTRDPDSRTAFGRRAVERKQIAARFQTELRRQLGGHPAETGTSAGRAHRTLMNLKAALTGSEKGIVNSLEAAEDNLIYEFEEALADHTLSAPVLDLLGRAFVSIRGGHDEMRDLKQRMEA